MRPAIRFNFCQLGAVAALLIGIVLFHYQEPIFRFFLFISLLFSLRSGQIYKTIPEIEIPFSTKFLYFIMLVAVSILIFLL